MKANTFSTLAVILMMIFTLVSAGCDNGTTNGNQNTPSTGTNPPAVTLNPALRAVPTASGTASSPKLLDSYTDGTKNYYLIDVGYVKNMFVSTVLQAAYNGMTPISVSKTTISTTTITNGLTETISESITISNTQDVKVGIEGAWEKKFPVAGKFSAKINVEWAGSWTNLNTSSRSTETSVSKTKSFEEIDTTSVTIGEHGEPAGNYRYALYAVCDVYFIISTSLDNQSLLSWDTVVCARDSSYIPHWDYTADGIFDNSPEGNAITFSEDFYKNLTKPVSTEPPVNTPMVIETDFLTIRESTITVTDAGELKAPMDQVSFTKFDINLNTLKQQGYKTVSFYIRLNVSEKDDGYQWLFLYSSPIADKKYKIAELRFEHSPIKDTNWWVHKENELKFENISIDKFVNNEFIIRYDASGDKADTWYNKDLLIQLVIKK